MQGMAVIDRWRALWLQFQDSEEATALSWETPLASFSGRLDALQQRYRYNKKAFRLSLYISNQSIGQNEVPG